MIMMHSILLLSLSSLLLDYSSIPSIEYMSSSEEQEALLNPNPFSKARRSKKYTSKKSYKNYLQARPRNNSTASNDVDFQLQQQQSTSDSNNNNIAVKQQSTNGVSKSFRIASGGGGNISGAGKFSLIMNDIHGIKHQHEAQSNEIYDDTHSSKINRMHGISRSSSLKEKGRGALPNDDDDDDETRDNQDHNNENERGKSMENGNQSAINNKIDNVNRQQSILVTPTTTTKYCDEDLVVKQKIATRDDWYMSDVDETETAMSMTKTPYGNVTGVSNSVLECVNQILLQQSMDEFMDTQHHHHHHQHQQQPSIQEKRSSFASNDSKDSQSSNNVVVTPPTRTNKRVHFSTKNSMVQITPLPPRQMLSDLHENSTYENQSTYSNEYEPIGSARTYVDMDSKSLDNYKPKLPPKPDNLMKLSRQRSLLVHEPCYVKNRNNSDYDLNGSEPDYCSISEIQDNINSVKVVTAEIHNEAAHVDDGDEEDVNEPENGQHVDDDNEYDEIKEVPTHNKSHNSSGSSHTLEEVAEESFEDVPKLPNVYSIVPLPSTPIRKESTPTKKIIGHDNYITKSPMKKKITSPSSTYLSDINNISRSKKSLKSLPPKVPPPPLPASVNVAVKDQQQSAQLKIIDEKFQEEFDWYNLDAEYTKSMDVISTQIENIDEMYQFDDENLHDKDTNIKVEYNLEFEFDNQQEDVDEEDEDELESQQKMPPPRQLFSTSPPSSSSEGNEMESNSEAFTTVIKINNGKSGGSGSSPSASELSSTPPSTPPATIKTTNLELAVAETPKLDLKKKLNYEKFLNESGMLSKSLLGGRKKFYAGSFV